MITRHVDPLRFWEPYYAQDFSIRPHYQLLVCDPRPCICTDRTCSDKVICTCNDNCSEALAGSPGETTSAIDSEILKSLEPRSSEQTQLVVEPAPLCVDKDGIIENMAMSSPFNGIAQATKLPESTKPATDELRELSGLSVPNELTQSSEPLSRSYQLLLVRWIISRAHKAMPSPQDDDHSIPFAVSRGFNSAENLRMPSRNGPGTKWLRIGHSLYHPASATTCGNQVQSKGIQQMTAGGATAA